MAAVPYDELRIQMQKKIISLILCGILVFGTFSISYAVSTDSAIKATNELKALGDTKAATEVSPSSSSGYYYYYNGTSNLGYSNINLTTWAGLITGITQGIANSIKNLATYLHSDLSSIDTILSTISTRIGNIESYVDGVEGYLYNINNALHYGQTGIGSLVNDLKTLLTTNNTTASNISSDTSNIYSLLQNGINTTLNDWQPYMLPAHNVLTTNTWQYTYIPYWDWTGQTKAYFDGTETSFARQVKLNFVAVNRSLTYGFEQLLTNVKLDNSFVPKIYKTDLTTSNASKTSLWRSLLEYSDNTSMFLSRLAFVLASDEEIEARQAAAANQDEVVDSFIKPTGSGSASASDFADVASIGGTMKDALDSNVSPSSAFTSLSSSSDAWKWFSTDTAYSLDTSSNQRSSVSSTPLLDNYYSEVLENLRFK